MKLPSAATILLLSLTSSISTTADAFRATPSSPGRRSSNQQHQQQNHLPKNPLKIESISKLEVTNRLGLKTDPKTGVVSIGSDPNQVYNLHNEHEVICPITETHQGVLTTYTEFNDDDDNEEYPASTMANNHELVSQAILSGSLAASIRNRCKDGNSLYYLPSVVTLVESLAEDVEACLFDAIPNMGEMMFNAEGLETNEILMDLTDMNDDAATTTEEGEEARRHLILFARNTHFDPTSATSDVYLLPSNKRREGKVWKFSIEYKVATINLRQIKSFGVRDSTTPLRPDVWLKDDCYW
mmetsp:Transcript_23967/g.36036  ORF Transcript_23967/g.36036 Transcript_23967/m.36036 type:complete len:298 (+) Transcript_23967:170-1063(+)